jgi:DNA invertase Pin-like site-specific DNA recombinase
MPKRAPPSNPHLPAPLAISYARVSTPEQAKRHGIRRQVERAVDYSNRNGLRYDESILAEGVSAFRGAHRSKDGALKRFVDRVECGEIPAGTYLLVESLDRLSREEVFDALTFFMRLIGLGFVIVTLGDGERVYSRERMRGDHSQLMMSLFVMARAYEESATKSDRVGRAWAAKRERARETKQAMTARCPAWIRLVGGPRTGRYELIEERAAVIRQVFEKTLAGVGRRTIAREMNARGVPAWGNGKLWHDSYVAKILSNPAAYGAFTPLGKMAGGSDEAAERIDGYFPAVVDEQTFRLAQAASKARGAGAGRPSRGNSNLLRGLAKCESCGSTMVYLQKGARSKGPVLKCGRAHQAAGCDHRQTHEYLPIEIGVIHGLGSKRAALSATAVDAARAAENTVSIAVARRDEAKSSHERLLDLYARGINVPFERMEKSGAEASIAEAAVREAEAARDRAKLADPEFDVDDVARVHRDLAALAPEDRTEARAALHEKLKRMVDDVVIGARGVVVHYADGSTATGARVGSPR